ncbi:spore coat protein [Spirochaetia bacterium]|nr:spore coat protein [Spirochaetia bacterium]
MVKGHIEPIPFARPFVGKEEEDAVLRVLRSGWLTTGQETLAFEKEFGSFLSKTTSPVTINHTVMSYPAKATLHGVENHTGNSPSTNGVSATSKLQATRQSRVAPLPCLAVNSATSGLHLALEACGIGPGDIVLVPSCTFTSTAEVARYLGAESVFVDVAPGSFHLDPKALERTLEKLRRNRPGKAKAVMPVHYGGLPCDMKAIMEIARHYGLRVIEDAAHSFPSMVPGTGFAGTIGDAGVFSFYATKTMTTGEGGMVVCRDSELAARISIMRSHGIDRSVWNRYTDTKASWYYEVAAPGFKYNLPDILSALGRVQLGRAWDMLRMRETIARRYNEAFAGDGHFILPPSGPGNAWHLYPLRLRLDTLSIDRDAFIRELQEGGIGVSVHFIPLHTMPYYKKTYHLNDDDFPETMKSFRHEISLPIWQGMTGAQVERVIAMVKGIAGKYT